MLGVGDQVPELSLCDLHGAEQPLRDEATSKPLLVTFFKISCPVCQFTLPFIERFVKSDNVDVIAISQDDAEATQDFREALDLTVPTLLDQRKKGYPASNAFGISHVPAVFLIDPDGSISIAAEGFSKKELEAVGHLAGIEPFRPDERVPEWKSG
jgi:peroxiredoxin